ncbi:MAG: hypothetical protein QNJ18_03255 [Xenococcaceae cyanobacterium MO_167.B52]|nr:hypothetical protein [Xenococcaceae cyanobacterium MO_167.B52]
MKTQWQQLFLKVLFWLALEAIFNLIGIDDLADYSEFLITPKTTMSYESLVISNTQV